jgi:peroxiredoxin
LRRHGARLVAVTPQRPDRSRAQLELDGYPFEVLSDLDDQVMRAYRLYFELPEALVRLYRERLSLDLADYNGAGRYGLPVPATFVIDRQGVVRAAFADVDYRKRMEPAAILAALERLATP